MTTVLVTGGAGFIGSHMCELLLERGFRVRVLDNLSQGRREWVPRPAEFVCGDVTSLDDCNAAMSGASGVFHLAAMSKVVPSLGRCEKTLHSAEQNILGTINILIAAKNMGVEKVVYSASSTYYGNQPVPHHEGMLPQCLTPYAVSKYVGEQYCELFHRMYQQKTICLRYFQVYGLRQPSSGPYAVVAGIFLDQRRRNEPLTIHGDGSQRRDFVAVKDVAMANYLAFVSPVSGVAINVGTGDSHSVKELADMISPCQVNLPPRQHDSKNTQADTARCERLLGWRPRIMFHDGMSDLIRQELKDIV